VKFPARGDVESWWLEVLQRNTFTNKDNGLPDIGELVAVLLDDKEEAGCILGAVYTEANKPPSPNANARRVTFGDGTVIEYDRAAHKLKASVQGDIEATATGDAHVTAVNVHITGATTVTGTSHLDGVVTVGAGADAVALATKVATELGILKSAIAGAPVVPLDGGASLKAAIVAALATWPTSVAAAKLSSD